MVVYLCMAVLRMFKGVRARGNSGCLRNVSRVPVDAQQQIQDGSQIFVCL